MPTSENTATRRDVFERVTSSIVRAIEAGAGAYRMPWVTRRDKGLSPISVGTAKPYRGINTLVLWAQSQALGYGSALWGTYQQWQELGGQVRRAERGSPVVYWGTWEGHADADGEDREPERHLFARGYTVFNLDQVDGCRLPRRLEEPKLSHHRRIERAEGFFAALPSLKVKDGGNRAFYRPDTDAVYMPGFNQFPEPKDYYSVLAHETTHWTSHASRCDRQLGKRFGDEAYAMEELIAELGSAYTMAHLELELTPRMDHANYIQSWLRVLKHDKRAVFTAASKAQQAADFLIRQGQRASEAAA